MTGQVKEEILTRFGELGVRVEAGAVRFAPVLLHAREFLDDPGRLRPLRSSRGARARSPCPPAAWRSPSARCR